MHQTRLGERDRRRIEIGLSEGRTYSDIARELGRSVSTVTREIARNGGPSRYRAARAQRETQRRVRRRAPRAAPPERPVDSTAHGRDPQAVDRFEVDLTARLVATGLPRMNARVLACLHTTDAGSLTAAELCRRLGVSSASISKAIGYLEEQGLVRRERLAGTRAERYLIDDDVWYRSMIANARSTAQLAEVAEQGVRTLGEDTPAGERLTQMHRLLDRIGDDLVRAAEDWRRSRSARS